MEARGGKEALTALRLEGTVGGELLDDNAVQRPQQSQESSHV